MKREPLQEPARTELLEGRIDWLTDDVYVYLRATDGETASRSLFTGKHTRTALSDIEKVPMVLFCAAPTIFPATRPCTVNQIEIWVKGMQLAAMKEEDNVNIPFTVNDFRTIELAWTPFVFSARAEDCFLPDHDQERLIKLEVRIKELEDMLNPPDPKGYE